MFYKFSMHIFIFQQNEHKHRIHVDMQPASFIALHELEPSNRNPSWVSHNRLQCTTIFKGVDELFPSQQVTYGLYFDQAVSLLCLDSSS